MSDYVNNMRSEFCTPILVHIFSHREVYVLSTLDSADRTRESYLTAVYDGPAFSFGSKMGQEEFMICMQSRFVQSDEVENLMKYAGNIVQEAQVKVTDDGVSQMATARTGVTSKVENVILPRIITLAPYRTFPEIEQPESAFVFRLHSNPIACSLHEADGGVWKMEAVKRIKEWLTANLPEGTVIIS